MLKEYLLEEAPKQAIWSSVMPGVQVCRFRLSHGSGETMRPIPPRGEPRHFETFFCLGGRLVAEPEGICPLVAEDAGVFLLSSAARLRACNVSGDLQGILIAVDAGAARDSLFSVCSTMGLTLDTSVVRRKMEARRGCAVLADNPWTRALFEELRRLPADHGGRYCVFKAVELLYLFCASDPCGDGLRPDTYRSHAVTLVRAYLETHLGEKQTIDALCRRFGLSSTSLKTGFRRMYGQSIHRWLTQRRMKRACELLRTSDEPVLNIAQAVGYESASQFSAAFKGYCGMTPGQYKKMSDTGEGCLF